VSPPVRKALTFIAFVALLLVGGRFVGLFNEGPVAVEIRYRLGVPPVAAALDVSFVPARGGGEVAHFATRLVADEVVERTRLPPGPTRLEITLVSAAGARHTVERSIEAERDAIVRVDLSRELFGEAL
jgi:hypothetical protein